ncbi:hypothetical protein NQ317_010407 [Molorchus minor]|uniref:Uncharacterized protein n=1 Tax=Molorchus minor TaxID=1323400 RepID=A0ABQ9JI55_9CUCU|nr:hypothetical protein NQ317_010407 [Molorchus minor]
MFPELRSTLRRVDFELDLGNRRYAPMYPPPAGSFAAKWGGFAAHCGGGFAATCVYMYWRRKAVILETNNYCILSTKTETILKI